MFIRVRSDFDSSGYLCSMCNMHSCNSDKLASLYSEDGENEQYLGLVCADCLYTLRTGGTAALAARLGTVAKEKLEEAAFARALAAKFMQVAKLKHEIRIEAAESADSSPAG